MDVPEVTEVLVRHEVDATDLTARLVQRHSHGWPCGVRLAALALKGASTTEVAMAHADRGAIDYLASEVLAKAPDRVRDLIVRTSMVDEVSRELATAVLGVNDVALDPVEASKAFLDLRSDGSFTCDPLIRAAARSQLAREPEGVAAEARRRAADWYVARGEGRTALALGTATQDWQLVARTLVESYAIPAILWERETRPSSPRSLPARSGQPSTWSRQRPASGTGMSRTRKRCSRDRAHADPRVL